MRKQLVLVRHGETEANLRRIIQGTSQNFGLTLKGQEQMVAVGRFLRDTLPQAMIWSSSLGRAVSSAQLLARETGFPDPILLPELQQRNWGSATGRSYDERSGETAYLGEPGQNLPDDAEPICAVQERLLRVIELIKRHPAAHHIIVSHNEPLNYVLDFWEGNPLRKYSFLSGEVMVFELETGESMLYSKRKIFPPRLVYLKDTSSLLQVEEAVKILQAHNLEPITAFTPETQEYVVAVVLADMPFSVKDADAFPRLRTVARFGSGTDNVDVHGLWSAKRIPVTCTPGLATPDVAEFTLAMLIITLRSAHTDATLLAKQNSQWRGIGRGRALAEATVGILGCGRIGLETTRLLQSCGAKVLVWNRSWPPASAKPHILANLTRALRLGEIAEKCDAVSLHLPLTPDTRHLMSHDFFDAVKRSGKSIVLVNTSRGEIVNEQALLAAIQEGTVRSAAIDVWSSEGKSANETVRALRTSPAVFPTSHIAAYTLGARQRYAVQCARNVVALVEGRRQEVEDCLAHPENS